MDSGSVRFILQIAALSAVVVVPVFLILVLRGALPIFASFISASLIIIFIAVVMYPLARTMTRITAWSTDVTDSHVPEPPDAVRGPLQTSLTAMVATIHRQLHVRDERIEQVVSGIRGTFNSLVDPIVALSDEGQVVYLNRTAEELLGTQAPGMEITGLLRDPRLATLIDATRTRATTGQVEIIHTDAHADRQFLVDAVPLRPDQTLDWSMMLMLRDITEVKRTEQMRVDFVANASHEIRSPLAAMIGCIETLQTTARNDPEAQEMFLGMMHDQGQRMEQLVDDLLSLSRIELREHTQPTGEVSVPDLLWRIRTSLLYHAEEKDISIDLDTTSELLAVRGDEGELEQAFYNLLSNAIKYGHAGTSVRVSTGVANDPPPHLFAAKGQLAWISVADQGDGIPAHHLPRLTERFYRVDTARSREMGGTGLGLAIVKHIMNRHRGELHISSTTGQGSVFTIWIPVA